MNMEVKVNLDTVTWSKDSHTLEDLVKKFKTDMPDYLKVDEAYYLYEDEFYCDQGDYFKVHGIREELVYCAIAVTTFGLEIRSTPVHIPLRYKGKVKLVPPNAFGKVYTGLKSVARDLPRYIQVVELPNFGAVTDLFSLETGDVLELLEINEGATQGMSRTMTFQKVDDEDYSKKIGHTFKLPVTSMGKFEYVRDPNEYTVMQIEEMQECLPGEKHVKFIEEETGNLGDNKVYKGEFILQNTFLKRELVCTEVTNTVESIDLLNQQEDPRLRYRPEAERKERLQLFVVDDKEMNATFNYYHLPRDVGNNKIDVGCLKSFIYFKMSPVNQYIPDHDYSYVRTCRTSNSETQGEAGAHGIDFDYEQINEPNESKDYDDVDSPSPAIDLHQSVAVPDENIDEGSDYETIKDEDLDNIDLPERPPKDTAPERPPKDFSSSKNKKKKRRKITPPSDPSQGKQDIKVSLKEKVKDAVSNRLKKTPSKGPADMRGVKRLPPGVRDVDDTLYDDAEAPMSMVAPSIPPKSPTVIKEEPDLPPVPEKCPELKQSIEMERKMSMKQAMKSPITIREKKVPPVPQLSPKPAVSPPSEISFSESIRNVKLKPVTIKQAGEGGASKITRTSSEGGPEPLPPVPTKSPKSAPPVFDKPKTNNLFLSELASKFPTKTAEMRGKEDDPKPKPRYSKQRKSNVPTATVKPMASQPEDVKPTSPAGPHLLRPNKSSETSVTKPKPEQATKPTEASESAAEISPTSPESPYEDDLCKSTARLSLSFEKFEDIPADVSGLTVKQLGEVLGIYGLTKVEQVFLKYHIDGEFFMNEMTKEDLEDDPFNLKGFALARVMTIKSKKKPM